MGFKPVSSVLSWGVFIWLIKLLSQTTYISGVDPGIPSELPLLHALMTRYSSEEEKWRSNVLTSGNVQGSTAICSL